jgi:hypothetical protein
MGEFMGEQILASFGARSIRSRIEKNILTGGKGAGIKIVAEPVGFTIRVNSDPAEVGAESVLQRWANASG